MHRICAKMPIGRVIKSTGSWYEVRDDAGLVSQCRLRGKIRLDGLRTTNPVAVGDIVNFEKQTMANKPYRYIILGDEKELNMEALEKIGPIKRLTTEEVFGY